MDEHAQGPSAQSWCGLARFGYKWCGKPTNATFTDYTSTRWPVGDAMNAWMYPTVNNSLGFAHHGSCNSIMFTNPTACAANITSCDAQAAGELYPY